jgi:hypothetical protein
MTAIPQFGRVLPWFAAHRIPPEIMDAVRLPPAEVEGELLKELALALYRRGALSLGKARTLAHMSRCQFEQLLGERQIARIHRGGSRGGSPLRAWSSLTP